MAIQKLFSVTAKNQLQLVTLLMKGKQQLVLLLFPTFGVLRNPSRDFFNERTTNRRHLFCSLQRLWQRIHRTDQTSVWYMFERASKSGFLFQKALSEHTCLTDHKTGWNRSKIIVINRCYYHRLCLELGILTPPTLLEIVMMAADFWRLFTPRQKKGSWLVIL